MSIDDRCFKKKIYFRLRLKIEIKVWYLHKIRHHFKMKTHFFLFVDFIKKMNQEPSDHWSSVLILKQLKSQQLIYLSFLYLLKSLNILKFEMIKFHIEYRICDHSACTHQRIQRSSLLLLLVLVTGAVTK